MWRLRPNDGGAQNVWSLGGNSSPISCLCFDDHELTLVSGSVGGSVRLYDLNEGRCTRAMAGHRNEVTCVDAHPFGDFLASGGADAAVRVWDARKKACIQTYKGHGGEVEDVKFSPDGRWVASASRGDGFVRVWDLTAGKLLRSFAASSRSAQCYATCLAFSPYEFVLAAACSDKSARLYDLERWAELGSTTPEVGTVRAVAFSASGNALCLATDTRLAQWAWDDGMRPLRVEDRVCWERPALLAAAPGGRVTAACVAGNAVAVWSAPLEGDGGAETPGERFPGTFPGTTGPPEAKDPAAADRPFATHKEDTYESDFEEDLDSDDGLCAAAPAPAPPRSVEVEPAEPAAVAAAAAAPPATPTRREEVAPAKGATPARSPAAPAKAAAPEAAAPPRPGRAADAAAPREGNRARLSTSDLYDLRAADAKRDAPPPVAEAKGRREDAARPRGPDDAITSVLLGRPTARTLEARTRALRRAAAEWGAGDAGAAFRSLLAHGEDADAGAPCAAFAVAVDFLGRVDLRALTLDHAVDADRLADGVLAAHADGGGSAGRPAPRHVGVALEAAAAVLDLYGAFVADATRDGIAGPVDIAREDRVRRCRDARTLFGKIRRRLPALRAKFAASRRVDDLAASLEARFDGLF